MYICNLNTNTLVSGEVFQSIFSPPPGKWSNIIVCNLFLQKNILYEFIYLYFVNIVTIRRFFCNMERKN